jgi:uncharacterized membrane protein YtjA (UPF0391 family)
MGLLKWALFFFVLAAIAGLFGFTNLAAGSADIAKVLFFIFLVIFAVIGILAMTAFRAVT